MNIFSYIRIPSNMRRICVYWNATVEIMKDMAIYDLVKSYPGLMNTIDGQTYSTIYTSIRESIRAENVEVLSKVVNCSGYIPVPWDLLAYDVSF